MIAVVDNYILVAGDESMMGSLLFQGMLQKAAIFAKEHGLEDVKIAHNPSIRNQKEFYAFVEEFKNL